MNSFTYARATDVADDDPGSGVAGAARDARAGTGQERCGGQTEPARSAGHHGNLAR